MAAPRLGSRLLWFAALWVGSVLTLAVIAYAIRMVLGL
jgi:hypothetical protein